MVQVCKTHFVVHCDIFSSSNEQACPCTAVWTLPCHGNGQLFALICNRKARDCQSRSCLVFSRTAEVLKCHYLASEGREGRAQTGLCDLPSRASALQKLIKGHQDRRTAREPAGSSTSGPLTPLRTTSEGTGSSWSWRGDLKDGALPRGAGDLLNQQEETLDWSQAGSLTGSVRKSDALVLWFALKTLFS